MKIMMANKFFFKKGGAETVFFQERDFLIYHGIHVVDFSMRDPRNFQSPYSDFFSAPRDYHDKKLGSWKKLAAALTFITSPDAVRAIRRLIEQERPDILHAHNIYHQLTPSILLAAHQLGVRTILTLHDYKIICPVYTCSRQGNVCTECTNGAFFNALRHRCSEGSLTRSAIVYLEAIVQRFLGSYESVDRIIVPSRFMGEMVTKWRLPKERVTVLLNGVDGSIYPPSTRNEGYILYFGRLSHEKGLETLGRAQKKSGVRVVVAGTGPLESYLKDKFPDLELISHQSGEALRRWIDGAASVVVPSQWYENCSMSVLEAMAAGKAVIGSRIGGIPEQVLDRETGFLFTPGDAEELAQAMIELSSDRDLARRMGENGRKRLDEHYSLDAHNRGLMDIYRHELSARDLLR